MKYFLTIFMLINLSIAQEEDVSPLIEIEDSRGQYHLNFDATYKLNLQTDIQTVITVPDGYLLKAAMPGSRDFISIESVENSLYLSKPTPESMQTNLTIHVMTPEGVNEKLIFDLKGYKTGSKAERKQKKILAVHFMKPNSSALNRTIETMKATYEAQLAAKLADQERKLTVEVTAENFAKAIPLFFDAERGDISEEYKGAKVWIEGVINSDNDTYVYLKGSVKEENCNIIKMTSVAIGDTYNSATELVDLYELKDGTFMYVYKVPKLPVYGEPTDVKFRIQIWSEKFTIEEELS